MKEKIPQLRYFLAEKSTITFLDKILVLNTTEGHFGYFRYEGRSCLDILWPVTIQQD